MNVANKVEYIATDDKKQEIPWVRIIDTQGVVTEFRTPDFDGDPNAHEVHTMDCMDCHNRPSHIFQSPNDAVDLSLTLGRLDPQMPSIKKEAVSVLTGSYETEVQALQVIATQLNARYAGDPRVKQTIEEVQRIYRLNFFPEMDADWSVYPDNIGHKDWLGCARCHDDQHSSPDGSKVIKFSDCNSCHLILAQGAGEELEQLSPAGQSFRHPLEDYDPDFKCTDCHTGGP